MVVNNTPQKTSQVPVMKELLSMLDGVRVCSRLHSLVHEFRAECEGVTIDPQKRSAALSRYTVDRAPSDQVEAITRLSTPSVYADLRHGGRLQSPYPPLAEGELVSLCQEIRAALVWKTTNA